MLGRIHSTLGARPFDKTYFISSRQWHDHTSPTPKTSPWKGTTTKDTPGTPEGKRNNGFEGSGVYVGEEELEFGVELTMITEYNNKNFTAKNIINSCKRTNREGCTTLLRNLKTKRLEKTQQPQPNKCSKSRLKKETLALAKNNRTPIITGNLTLAKNNKSLIITSKLEPKYIVKQSRKLPQFENWTKNQWKLQILKPSENWNDDDKPDEIGRE